MNRYSNVEIIRNENEFVGTIGTQYYTNNTYPIILPNENDIWVETEFGDRLDSLAFQFYQDVTLYWIISIANPNKINMGSLFLTPGTQIRIPTNVVQIVDSYNLLNR
tara:strand:- start:144 stop:464 length:321 start_codon:yes stop_codon:yes gene_type:complete